MFTTTIKDIGKYRLVTLSNADETMQLSLLPNYGGCVTKLVLNGITVIDGYQTEEAITSDPSYKNVFLLPFPNRLKDGKYQFEGKTYQFPINDTANHTALHGFEDYHDMTIEAMETEADDAYVVLSYDYEGSNAAYPFPLRFELSFKLQETLGFLVRMKVTNTGNTALPIGMGWHPYFQLGEGTIDNWKLQLPSVEKIIIDDRMIPTGEQKEYTDFTTQSTIGDTAFDTGFQIKTTAEKVVTKLSNDQHTLTFWQETGVGKFNYLQIYTPSDRTTIAIEPMTCNIDAFNNGDGLCVLQPNESTKACFGVSL